MNKPVDWQSFVRPLDVSRINQPPDHILRWEAYDGDDSGVVFHCRTARDRTVDFRVDFAGPDVVRVRLNPDGRPAASSEMLDGADWPPTAFTVASQPDVVTVSTSRLRLEFQRFPWQMRAYGVDSGPPSQAPFFSERVDDRAYGPAFEVAPVGFDEMLDGSLGMREAVAVTPGESFYGFGEKFSRLDKWGHELTSWAVDSGNVSSQRSYKNVPFFMSTAGYGVFVHSSFPIVYRMGSESALTYSFHIEENRLDYFLIYGPELKRVLERYADLTGHAPVPPKWSFGFWLSRAGYRSRVEVEAVARELRHRDFPADVISLDPWWMGEGPWCTYQWNETAFPEPAEMIRGLRALGLRTCLWVTPYVPYGTDLYAEGASQGYFIRKANGTTAPVLEAFAGRELAAIDFTNPQASAWYTSKLAVLLDQGVAVFKTDFGEQAPLEAVYADGRTGLEMHNLYPLLYNRAVFELARQRYGRGLIWARSAYAGSQRYPVHWGGDSYSSLDQLASQLLGQLSFGMSGVPFSSHDVGGFDYAPGFFEDQSHEDFLQTFGDATKAEYPKDARTYVRWLQAGVFSSHVRAHGKQPHEPWTYGAEAEAIARKFLKLRYRLLPYIYSQAVRCSHSGLPMVRPMVLEFQADPTTTHLDQEYLFGDSLLAAPVLRPDNRCRVYLPAGQWVNYWTKQVEAGGRWLDIEAPLDTLPLWVRAGTILPIGPDQDYVDQRPLDPLTLELYAPGDRGETVLCDEDKADIVVRYWRTDAELHVEVGPTPGRVNIVLYGLMARAARAGTLPLSLANVTDGQVATVDGRQGNSVTFEL